MDEFRCSERTFHGNDFTIFILDSRKRTYDLKNEHCVVTGGSSGIGLAIAIQSAKMGANVTIIARSKARLQAAKDEISTVIKNSQQKVLTFSVDLSKDPNLKDIVKEAEDNAGPITMLINCAGTSICHRFEETPIEEFRRMLDINFLGSINMTQAVLPYMKERKFGRIGFVSSIAGLVGIYGYSAYSGSKYAILGAAEALNMEVQSHNIKLKDKPIETVRISESAGLFSAKDVAIKTLDDILNKKFMSSVGFEGSVLCYAFSCMKPSGSFLEVIIQVFTVGLLRLVTFVHLKHIYYTVRKCAEEKEREKK
ncbi:3-dehydrosphinganine reductase TSC10B [Trichonephila inaurata madagascariensis]|uniref:3-dehydrosphinganine reductase n=1 Tax=Trichonephila inaurata madagascariensis TaxID=2747483 RepID=A0A8X6X5A2_9ARAC|nr:3-dehydrosphinganine reductase TSC10B [Trichonephila inaurata madagascariensis]